MPSGKDSPRIANAGGWRHICFPDAISLDAHDRTVLLALVLVGSGASLAIMSPLELGVDEAQYWLWSTEFDFGYYTKPPLTSWIIGASPPFRPSCLGGATAAPWIHLATALVLWRAGSGLPARRPGAGRRFCGPACRRSRSAVS